MAYTTCEVCGEEFKHCLSGERRRRFCGQVCYHAWRKREGVTTGQFKRKHRPWNKGKKGLRMSPGTEFKKGLVPKNKREAGTVTVRTRKRDGRQRAWVKVAEPNVWRLRATVVWERRYGPISDGLVVHHLDGDTLNDSLGNLAVVSRAAHVNIHRADLQAGKG